MELVLMAGFDRYSGYGCDAVDLAMHMNRVPGVRVTPYPTSLVPGLPQEFADMLVRHPSGPKDAVIRFAPPFDVKPWELEGPKLRIGYSMWERTPLAFEDFLGHGWEPHDMSWVGLDAMVVTCEMNVEAFRPIAGPDLPMPVVPCGITPDEWPVAERKRDRPLRFLMQGMLAGRKDPFLLLEVWKELKAEVPEFDAQLHLHTLATGVHPAAAEAYGPDLTISTHPLAREDVPKLFHDHDVLISVSRGEGNNKPAMEMMATGGTVMASDWSGHQNWLHPAITYALPGRLEQARSAPAGVMEFAVDRDALKAQLLHCWRNREDVRNRGRMAAAYVRQTLSWDRVARQLLEVVEGLL